MTAKGARDWLDVWETTARLSAAERPIALLRAAGAAATDEQLLDLPIGRRDALLIDLRRALFGPTLRSTAQCPACALTLELDVPLAAVRCEEPPDPVELVLDTGDLSVSLRVPTTRDLIRVAGCRGVVEARDALAAHTIRVTDRDGTRIPMADVPVSLMDAALERMRAADPQAAVIAELSCPGCAAACAVDVDIARYLWLELDHWASQLIEDVHELACAYGWSEADTLALSPGRRQRYLDLLAS